MAKCIVPAHIDVVKRAMKLLLAQMDRKARSENNPLIAEILDKDIKELEASITGITESK